jgi:two-component system nitrogen regulation response regulator GlnG
MSHCISQVVYVSDEQTDREAIVFELVRETGVIPERFPIKHSHSFGGSVSVVGLPAKYWSDDRSLSLICELKQLGHVVIAYANGTDGWSLGTKCRPLLAGASRLMDSSKFEFKSVFVRVLSNAIRQANASQKDELRLRSLMKEHGLIGESTAIMAAFKSAVLFSERTELPVLITGESGTGKELLARSIAKMDPVHNSGPFVAVNCSAVPATMIESEIFGHRRGAFTGAERERKGWIRAADGGVLFLDEIGELELALQTKLLRVLEDHRVRSLGDDNDFLVTTRFLAATNRNLEEMVREGRFRNDLLNRIAVLRLETPSLCHRSDDIPKLIDHFVKKNKIDGTETLFEIDCDYVAALQEVRLHGNIRQLENIVRQSVMHRQHRDELCLHDLPLEILSQLVAQVTPDSMHANGNGNGVTLRIPDVVKDIAVTHGWNLQVSVREFERIVCGEALKITNGNQKEAARLLGVTSRSVYNKLHRFAM